MADQSAEDKEKKASRERLKELCKRRLMDARKQKAPFELDMREGYFFAAPHRMRSVSSQTKATPVKSQDASELNTSLGFEVCGDFPTVMLNAFMPETRRWVIRKAGPMVPPELKEELEAKAGRADEEIFKSIRASNFYAEFGKASNPDLALGVIGFWIDHPHLFAPPVVQAVPIREIEINIGPDGRIDDRFIVRHTKRRYLKAILPKIPIPQEVYEKGGKGDDKTCVVVWAFWRIYDDTGDVKWQHVITIDGIFVHEQVFEGEGSCPFVVGRFGATPEFAWAVGPLIQALPEFRQIDELAMKKIKNVDMSLDPPVTYPDRSFTNVSEGIESGMAYPIRPGEENAIKNIYDPPSIDAAIFLTQDMEQRVKRLFFLDWPQQRGDTPPTATQWIDEMTLAQRRIGTPGLSFFSEVCVGVFMRFTHLLEQAGQVEKITIAGKDGKKTPVAMLPYNPVMRAAEQEEVALFTRFAEIGTTVFPEEWKIATDGGKTLKKLATKMGVESTWEQRSPADVKNAIANISQLFGGAQAGAPALPGGEPMPADIAGPAPKQPTTALNL
jgi:hypothetical protein